MNLGTTVLEDLDLLVDLHRHTRRQGPGGEAETEKAIELAGLRGRKDLKVADIGCGTGASTRQLASSLDAEIIAVDLFPTFLHTLRQKAARSGLSSPVITVQTDMQQLPLASESLDVIWSEGAIYIAGFENGVNAWRQFLKPGGMLVVSEITWTGPNRPRELQEYWEAQYPEIDTLDAKQGVLQRAGYENLPSFFLPQSCWLDNYYKPLEQSFPEFLRRHDYSEAATQLVSLEEKEIAFYNRYKSHFSYAMYIARKLD